MYLYSCCKVIIIIIIIVFLFYFTEQQYNYNTNIYEFGGAFILAETRRKTSVLLFVDNNSIRIYLIANLGRCLSHVSHCHAPLKKLYK